MKNKKTRHIIAAITDDFGIGYNGDLIHRIPADMAHFKELTLGNVIIMGRKTFESIGKPLNCRDNIVVTSKDLNIEGVHCVRTLEEAYELAEELDGLEVYVIGGGKLYEAALPYTDIIDLTEIFLCPHHVDVYFPKDLSSFLPVYRSERYWDKDNITFRFVKYKHKNLFSHLKY